MRRRAGRARPGGPAVLALLVAAALHGCSDAGDTTTPAVAASTTLDIAATPPDGTALVGTLSWDEGRAVLDEAVPGLAARLDELGLADASVTVFATPGAGELLELDGTDRLLVGATLTFGDGDGAHAARGALRDAATEYAAAAGVATEPFSAAGLPPGAVGLAVPAGTFPGGAAAAAWVDGEVLLLAFAQGGSAGQDAAELAALLTGGPP